MISLKHLISVIFLFDFVSSLITKKWLFNQERQSKRKREREWINKCAHPSDQLEIYTLFDRIHYLSLLFMLNTYIQNSLDNSFANKSLSLIDLFSYVYNKKKAIVYILFIIFVCRWSRKERRKRVNINPNMTYVNVMMQSYIV